MNSLVQGYAICSTILITGTLLHVCVECLSIDSIDYQNQAVTTDSDMGTIGLQPATQQGVAADANPVGRVKSCRQG